MLLTVFNTGGAQGCNRQPSFQHVEGCGPREMFPNPMLAPLGFGLAPCGDMLGEGKYIAWKSHGNGRGHFMALVLIVKKVGVMRIRAFDEGVTYEPQDLPMYDAIFEVVPAAEASRNYAIDVLGGDA